MKITKKQIVALDKNETTVRELFPEVFETKLEVGKWYKKKDFGKLMFCFSGKFSNWNTHPNYGFNYDGKFSEIIGCFEKELHDYIPATKEEVETALINEAKRRGFKKGICCLFGSLKDKRKILTDKFHYDSENNILDMDSDIVFNKGIWTEIVKIQTMTKEEIEKELGYEIEIKL